MRFPALAASVLLMTTPALAKIASRPVDYQVDGKPFQGVLLFDDASKAKRPGLVLVPNWLGVNEANVKQASEIARRGYVVLVADMFGRGAQPKTQEEAGKLSGALKADRALMRGRVQAALGQLLASAATAPVDAAKLGAIGFCFGGTSALELARSGAKVGAVVSFHGGLGSPTPADAKNITARVLALHGADDPFVPPEEVKAFEDEMRGAKVDWQLVSFGNAVHSFTDVDAKVAGKSEYNPKVAARAYRLMDALFAETFGPN